MPYSRPEQGYPRDQFPGFGSRSSQYGDYNVLSQPLPPQVPSSRSYLHQPQRASPVLASERVPAYHYTPTRETHIPQLPKQPGHHDQVLPQRLQEEIRESDYYGYRRAREISYRREPYQQATYPGTNQILASNPATYSTAWDPVAVHHSGEDEVYYESGEHYENEGYNKYEESELYDEYGESEKYSDYEENEEYNDSCSPVKFARDGLYSSAYGEDDDLRSNEEFEVPPVYTTETAKDPPHSIRLIPGLVSKYGMEIYNELNPEARAMHCQNIESETLDLRRENAELRKLCMTNNMVVSSDTLYDMARHNRPRCIQGTLELYEEITPYSRKLHNWYIRAEFSILQKENEELRQILEEEYICAPPISRNESHPLRQYAIRVQYGQLCTDQDLGTLGYF